MTATMAPPCPSWCDPRSHDASDDHCVHHSAPHVWEDPTGDFPRVEVRFERGDETIAEYPNNIGQTVLDITFTGLSGFSVRVADDGSPILTGYFLPANAARSFAQWWLDLAAQIDPNNTNGEPPEWASRPPAGLRPGPRDEWLAGCQGIEGM